MTEIILAIVFKFLNIGFGALFIKQAFMHHKHGNYGLTGFLITMTVFCMANIFEVTFNS